MTKNTTTAKLLEKHFDTAFEAPDGIKKLRELILTLAMQGKLVPQNLKDQPASELLKDIQAEKERLLKEGKIKKAKPLPEIGTNEEPHELPDSWVWGKLGNLTNFRYGKTPPSKNPVYWSDSEGENWAAISDLPIRGYLESTKKRITEKATTEIFKSSPVPSGSLLMSFKLSIGKTALTSIPAYHNEAIISFFEISETLKMYLYWILFSVSNAGDSKSAIKGKTLNSTSLNNLLIPLPPLAEQKRIVARVDTLMARCDALEALREERAQIQSHVHAAALHQLLDAKEDDNFDRAWKFITQHFSELYSTKDNVTELRKTILQLAVQGKLVPQNPKDQPASELLKEIQVEKAQLVKEGKLKKSKPLSEIGEDEIPYKIPGNWKWIRFFDVAQVKSELVQPDDFQEMYQIAPDSIEKGTGRLIKNRTVAESGITGPNNRFYEGQILYSKIRPSLSKAIIAPYDGLCSADMYPTFAFINKHFLLKMILSETFLAQVRVAENRVKMPKLNLESLGKFLIPLPPLAEQKRIVAKVDQLMSLCDALETHIDQATTHQSTLLNAVMAHV